MKWKYKSKNGMDITVRNALPEDARNLFSGFNNVVKERKWLPVFSPSASLADWSDWIRKTHLSKDVLLVAEINGKYAGHLTLQSEEWDAAQHVARLGIIVVKNLRDNGVGNALMRSAEEAAVTKEFEKIILSTFEDNEIAKCLYNSLGYRTVGFRKRHFKMARGYISEILLEKELETREFESSVD